MRACAWPKAAAAAAPTPAASAAARAEPPAAASGRLELGEQLVDHVRRQAAQPGGRDLATERGCARVVAAVATGCARNRDQFPAQTLGALADVVAELSRSGRSR